MRSGGSNGLASRPRNAKVFAFPTWAASARSAAQSSIRRASGAPTRYHSSIVNSGACKAVRSRLRKTCEQGKDLRLAGAEKLLHREFRRGMQPGLARRAVRRDQRGAKSVQMRLVAGRGLERGRVDLDEAVRVKPPPHESCDARPRHEPAAAFGVAVPAPEGRGGRTHETLPASEANPAVPGWPSPSKPLYTAPQTETRRLSRSDPARKSRAGQISRTET